MQVCLIRKLPGNSSVRHPPVVVGFALKMMSGLLLVLCWYVHGTGYDVESGCSVAIPLRHQA